MSYGSVDNVYIHRVGILIVLNHTSHIITQLTICQHMLKHEFETSSR